MDSSGGERRSINKAAIGKLVRTKRFQKVVTSDPTSGDSLAGVSYLLHTTLVGIGERE